MKYIIALFMVALGFFLIWKTDWMMRSFGRIDWAERKLGSGGSWTFYKLVGLGFIFFAFLLVTGGAVAGLDVIFGR